MFDLLEDTRSYWQALNHLERAYQNGEVSVSEVDMQVKQLMADLSRSRRAAFRDLWAATQHFIQQQRDAVLVVGGIALLTYLWANFH